MRTDFQFTGVIHMLVSETTGEDRREALELARQHLINYPPPWQYPRFFRGQETLTRQKSYY
jgi:hypothetical protein